MEIKSEKCSKCKYDLTGLANAGKCPECGNAFNIRTGRGVVSPLTDHQKTDAFLSMLKAWVFAFGAGLILLLGLTLALLRSEFKPFAIALVIAVALAVASLHAYLQHRQYHYGD